MSAATDLDPLEREFQRALVAQPCDWASMAMYADWLEERGNRHEDARWWRYQSTRRHRPRPSRTGKTVEWWLEMPEYQPAQEWEIPSYIWYYLQVKDRRPCRPSSNDFPGAPKRMVARYHNRWTDSWDKKNFHATFATARALADLERAYRRWYKGSHGFLRGQRLWSGDEWCDKQAGCPSIYDIWKEKFGTPLELNTALHREDWGDAYLYFMPNGHCVCLACDGNYLYETLQTGDY